MHRIILCMYNEYNILLIIFESLFRFDTGKDGYLDLGELKRMMEKLGVPQTHLALKAMIKEVDEDGDDKISFREVRNNRRIIKLQPVGLFDFTYLTYVMRLTLL